jgi:hypothetical protein
VTQNKKTSQFENDVDRLQARTDLITGSFEGAADVKQGYLEEAKRHFEHAFLYLKASIQK